MELKNPTTKQSADAAMERVPEQLQEDFERALGASLDMLFSEETHKMITEHMSGDVDRAELIGQGCAGVVLVVWSMSNGNLPMRVLIPAGVVVTCHALELMQEAGALDELTGENVGNAIAEFSTTFLQAIGATPEKIEEMMAQQQAGGAPAEEAPMEQAPMEEPAAPGGIVGQQLMGG